MCKIIKGTVKTLKEIMEMEVDIKYTSEEIIFKDGFTWILKMNDLIGEELKFIEDGEYCYKSKGYYFKKEWINICTQIA